MTTNKEKGKIREVPDKHQIIETDWEYVTADIIQDNDPLGIGDDIAEQMIANSEHALEYLDYESRED